MGGSYDDLGLLGCVRTANSAFEAGGRVVTKIYPMGIGAQPEASFKLMLVAEGFKRTSRGQFASLCVEMVETLLATTPFNRTRVHPEWLSVLGIFEPSADSGPRVAGSVAGHSTLLNSAVDAATHRLDIDHSKVTALFQRQTITTSNGTRSLSDLYGFNGITYGTTGGIVAVITPPIADPAGADDHVQPSVLGQYHLVATTANGLWPQVVLRGIGTALGLADEYERAEPDYAVAQADAVEFHNSPNVVFRESPPLRNADIAAWRHVMSATQRLSAVVVHPHAAGDLPAVQVPVAPVVDRGIAFWEGGAGFRRKAYRSAEDCLMRRAPGLGYLPARTGAVPFCPVCISHLRSTIG